MFRSFRFRVLALVLAVALPPLVLVGIWLTRNVSQSAERVLRARVVAIADATAGRIVHAWAGTRSELLDFVESEPIQRALASHDMPDISAPVIDQSIRHMELRALNGDVLWKSGAATDRDALRLEIPVFERGGARRLGTLDVDVYVEALLTAREHVLLPTGAVVAVLEPRTGVALTALPFEPQLARARDFAWGNEQWLAVSRPVAEPRLDLLVAAPHTPDLAALRAAARQGVLLLLLLGIVGIGLAWAIAQRLTRGLAELADASAAVANGDFNRQLPIAGGEELSRVAVAFNRMTENLNHTLRALSEREALAAVGEFSAELAHEIRNPLTAIRLDLQYVQERLPADSPLQEVQASVLAEIRRLDATVNSALLLSRSGRVTFEPVDVAAVVSAAARNAADAFARQGARLELRLLPHGRACTQGDDAALERLFLNLLLNAAAASGDGGCTYVSSHVAEQHVIVNVVDDGPGIAPALLDHIFDARFTTRRAGTGLGLTIAQRIARAHGGTIEAANAAGRGACFRVTLPRTAPAAVTFPGNVYCGVTDEVAPPVPAGGATVAATTESK
ncbi:MAG TPA: HAMP domain-containing sensor histidine kinase [Longimicrobiales bacterium]|nr:HAMP domain-containing sensor histidine kinase [Longimicrobiales bacterium]